MSSLSDYDPDPVYSADYISPLFSTSDTGDPSDPLLIMTNNVHQNATKSSTLDPVLPADTGTKGLSSTGLPPVLGEKVTFQTVGDPIPKCESSLSPNPGLIPKQHNLEEVSIQQCDDFGTSTTSRKRTPPVLEQHPAKRAAKGRKLEFSTVVVDPIDHCKVAPREIASTNDQGNAQLIGHTTPLVTIVEHLTNHGCPDVSSHLKSIDEHSRYSGSLSDVYQATWTDGTLVAVKCLRVLSNSDTPHANCARIVYMVKGFAPEYIKTLWACNACLHIYVRGLMQTAVICAHKLLPDCRICIIWA
ncbi:unnamed protein product [Rhizoctonia solani]|uniref:Protein kinase domain-containing protein n=1 Tax=Rhizoctonia solani TaxID=456999 RepID=A0A8H3AKD6_9AGAM|nr:unnamed protein product [Rhizoctonia solani]